MPRMSPASSRMDLNIPRAAGEEHFKKENLICAERPQDVSCSFVFFLSRRFTHGLDKCEVALKVLS